VPQAITSFISPDSFPFLQSIIFLLVVMIGGTGRTFGPLVGASVVVLLPEFLAELAQYRLLFVGLILLLALRLTLIATPELKVGTLLGRWRERAADLLRRLTWAPPPGRPRVNRTAQATLDIAAFLRTGARQLTLSVESISVSFGGVRAVQDLSFEAPPGKITTLIGPNGAGKSTVLNLISGYDRPDSGVVRLGVELASGRPSHQLARAGIARTYQTAQLFGHMSVLDNVVTALNRGYLELTSLFRPDRDPDRRVAAESLLAFVGYRGPLDRLAGALPHADMRLVEIARALATRPSVLALDEPAAGLPTTDRERLSALLVAVARLGVAVILVEHDMGLVMRVSDRVIVLDAGVRIADGAPGDIAANPAVRRAYLGEEGRVDRARRTAPATPVRTVLAADALAASYSAVSVLYDVDLSVAEGEFVAVLGANGAGKSTLTRALSGLLRPVSGTIRLRDRPLQGEPAHRVAAHGLILVPEGRQIFPELSVIDNLRLGGYLRPRGDLAAQIELLLKRFPPLARRLRQRAGLLSGGEQQMLAIARGLMARPSVLMLDEPSLGLAPKLVEDVYDLLMEIRDEGTTILLMDQMAVMALSIADRAYVLQSGVIRHSGPATRLRNDPELVRAFLGVSARNVVEGEQPWISS
jgi:branched-chain amino acid transport system ATP-binding protein